MRWLIELRTTTTHPDPLRPQSRMIRPLPTSLLLIGTIAGALATDADAQRRRRPRPDVKLEHLTYAEKSFESAALERETQYGVYLPKGYGDEENADRKYPLIIWLHGMWENHSRFQYRGGAPVARPDGRGWRAAEMRVRDRQRQPFVVLHQRQENRQV